MDKKKSSKENYHNFKRKKQIISKIISEQDRITLALNGHNAGIFERIGLTPQDSQAH